MDAYYETRGWFSTTYVVFDRDGDYVDETRDERKARRLVAKLNHAPNAQYAGESRRGDGDGDAARWLFG